MDCTKKLRVCCCVSALMLTISWILYIIAFFEPRIMDYAGIWWIGLFCCCLLLFFLADSIERRKKYRSGGLFSLWELPPTVKKLFLITVGITVVSLAVCIYLLRDGGPEMVNGVRWVVNHGKKIRMIQKSEFVLLSKAEAVLFATMPLCMHNALFAYFAKEVRWTEEEKKGT